MANEEIYASSEDEELSPFASSLVEKIVKNENLKAMDASKLHRKRIGRVPDVVRKRNGNAYSPTTISIGPLHRENEGLEDMEPVKLSYTHALLGRVGALKKTMELFAAAMLEMEENVWNSYDATSLPPNTQENVRWLAEVILIDACFIIELLWRYYEIKDNPISLRLISKYNDDPIFGNFSKYFAIPRDLVLLENQIPLSVLEKLFKLTVEMIPSQSYQHHSLTEWVIFFFEDKITELANSEVAIDQEKRTESLSSRARNVENKDPYHILHLLHIYLQPQQSNDTQVDDRKYDEIEKMEMRMKYSATELSLAGVELKRARPINQFNMKFTTSFSFISCWFMFRKGHIEIPPFAISDSTESILRNFIALEQSCPWIGSHFTSFAFLMNLLIDTAEDVKLLKEAGIILNGLGSDEEVAQLFNGICSNATAAGFHFSKQYQEAMDFCKHPCRAAMKNHREHPWIGISIIAGISLFFLTFISTLYTMLSYYH